MDMYSVIKNLFRLGKISTVNEEKGKARVLFEEKDDMVSKEYFLMFRRTKGAKEYDIPEIGEEVLCLCLPNGLEEGFIIGSYYNEENPPPKNDKEIYYYKFKDGSSIEVKDGVLDAKGFKQINFDGDLYVSGRIYSGND